MKNLNKDFNQKKDANLIWTEIQKEMKSKFGSEIYESWLKKIYFEEQHSNYLVVSVSTVDVPKFVGSTTIPTERKSFAVVKSSPSPCVSVVAVIT